jgi:hypothetical protein
MFCGFDVEDPTLPAQPQWVPKSLPESWPERGIDAHETGGIILEWEPNPENDIVAYNIYRAIWYAISDSFGDYEMIYRLETEANMRLSYVDVFAFGRTRYAYKINAEDASVNLSEFSDSLSYMILPRTGNESMIPNCLTCILPENRELSWHSYIGMEMEDYYITVLTEQDELVLRVRSNPGNYIGSRDQWQIPVEVILHNGNRYKWRIDTGADYIDKLETSGSESLWATFLYTG